MTYKDFIEEIISSRGRHGCKDEYFERHHIIPKSIGGKNVEENRIDLFPREHFVAHKLLALENPHNKKLQYAWWNMAHCCGNHTQNRYECTAEEYTEARMAHSNSMKGSNNPNYGGGNMSNEGKRRIAIAQHNRTRSEEEKQKRLKSTPRGEQHPNYNGKMVTPEFRLKQSISHLGFHHTEESKQKMSMHRKRGQNANAKPVVCDSIVFDCVKDCAEYLGVPYTWFIHRLKHNTLPEKYQKLNIYYLSKQP